MGYPDKYVVLDRARNPENENSRMSIVVFKAGLFTYNRLPI